MTELQEWSDAALSYLDALWAGDTHMAVIRKKLMPMLGFYPMPDQVRTMANRYKEAPKKIAAAAKPVLAPEPQPDPNPLATYHFVLPPRQDNPVRRVTPGTYPARNFSMLGGRTR